MPSLLLEAPVHSGEDRFDPGALVGHEAGRGGQDRRFRRGAVEDDVALVAPGRGEPADDEVGHQEPGQAGIQLAAGAQGVAPRPGIDGDQRQFFAEEHPSMVRATPAAAGAGR